MRKLYKVLAAAVTCVIAAGIVSCQEEKDGPLAVTPPSLEFVADGGTKTITVEGLNWEATENVDWMELQRSEDIVTVIVDKNETKEERKASITVRNSVDTKTVAVTQMASGTVGHELVLDPDKLIFTCDVGTKSVTVTSEFPWEATPDNEWITIEEGEGSFTVTVVANEGPTTRMGSVTVDNGGNRKAVDIEQAGTNSVIVEPSKLSFTRDGGDETVTVTSELDWTAIPNNDWITVDESDSDFTITVGDNEAEPRTGSVTVSNGEDEATVTIWQAGVIEVVYTKGNMGFFWDPYEAGTTNYEIDFKDEKGNYVNLNISTPLNPDMMQAYLPDGTYNYALGFGEFTFEGLIEYGNPEAIYFDESGRHDVAVTGGEFTSSYKGEWLYTVELDLEYSDGTRMIGSFEGLMSVWPDNEKDVYVNFNLIDTAWGDTGLADGFDALWIISLYPEESRQYSIEIAVNGERNLQYPPTGHFPMAGKARQSESGTAEPASMYDNEGDVGCINYGVGGVLQYSVPGEGFVDIEKIGDSSYKIEFEFMGPDGYTVSGIYSGYIEGGEPGGVDEKQKLISAYAIYWGDSGKGTGEYQISFEDNMGNTLDISYLYSDLVSVPDLSDGTYTYSTDSNKPALTFKNFYYGDHEGRGSFTILQDGDNYIIDFSSIQYRDGYIPEATVYRGPIEYDDFQ